MKRSGFLKALAVLPFAPAVLERLKPASLGPPLGYAHDFLPGEDPAMRSGPTGSEDESWVVEFAGATFYLDKPGVERTFAFAPFDGRLDVDDLPNGWRRLRVHRDGLTHSCTVKRGPTDPEWGWVGVEGAPQGYMSLATPVFLPRRIR